MSIKVRLLNGLSDKSVKPLLKIFSVKLTKLLYPLKSLSENQMISYIKHRLHVAGFRGDIFEDSAFKYIFNQSRGIPRLVNVICDRALLGAYTQDKIIITQKIVKNACKEVLGNLKNTQSKLSLFTNKLYILIIFASLITASFFFFEDFVSTFLYNLFNSSSLNVIA